MAHECPSCYHTCHCGGDIDDLNFGDTGQYCSHCQSDDEDVDDYETEEAMRFYCRSCNALEWFDCCCDESDDI